MGVEEVLYPQRGVSFSTRYATPYCESGVSVYYGFLCKLCVDIVM